jgi:hypothetical protein
MGGNEHDKSMLGKAVEAVKDFAANISEAAHKTAEPEPLKPGDEVVMMPMAADGLTSETVVPPFVVVRRPRKSSKKTRAKAAQKTVKTKSVKKTPKKAKKPARKTNSLATRKVVGKTRKRRKKMKAKKSAR